jgi:hypothetical protein
VIPLYRDELEYKLAHDADALLGKMNGISFVVEPDRQDAITRGTLSNDDFDGEMDDASYHIESIEEKELPIDPINAYNHMAIYLRWCMEHDLMGEDFLKELPEYERVRTCSPDIPDVMYERAAETNKYIATAPPVKQGRIELIHYIKEQSIAFEYHRYGSISEVPPCE